LHLADTVVAMAATCEDATPLRYADCPGWAATATYPLVEAAARTAREAGATVHVGTVVTSALFYDPDDTNVPRWTRLGHLGLEMEAGMLYTQAAVHGVEALALMTVSDILGASEDERERISDEQLRQGVDDMIRIACRVATGA
jgi:purine-nucleoside phosphorylase